MVCEWYLIVDTSPSTNLSCDFTNFDSCGYYDASEEESRWVATASSQVDLTGITHRPADCDDDRDDDEVSDCDDDDYDSVVYHLSGEWVGRTISNDCHGEEDLTFWT